MSTENRIFMVFSAFYVAVHSVHSNIAKIHSRLPAAMEFWLVCLGIVVVNSNLFI